MPSLFRRKSNDLAEETAPEETPPTVEQRSRAYTPSKKDRGVVTPKRSAAERRRVTEPPPANNREAAKRRRERMRAERAEAMEGMRSGDERYLMARDRGPERALVRDIVDSRRTAGTWFFVGAFVVLAGSFGNPRPEILLISNLLWVVLTLALVLDSVLICRRIKKLVRERFPKSDQRMGSLYLYGVMRAISFRKMRVPKPRVKIGEKI